MHAWRCFAKRLHWTEHLHREQEVLGIIVLGGLVFTPPSGGGEGAGDSNEDSTTSVSSIPEESILDIGVDGSLVEFYPGFEDHIRSALGIIEGLGPEGNARIRIGIAKDGSGVGAALIALVAAQQEVDG